jgi:hydrogenase maturation protein HypF
MLMEGKIVAIKGLGGFHLACDATNLSAVSDLRQRKLRVDKPFAVMMADIDAASSECVLSDAEAQLLECIERPIVILQRKPDSSVVPQVAPGQGTLGVMLPYTPLHSLILEREQGFPRALFLSVNRDFHARW